MLVELYSRFRNRQRIQEDGYWSKYREPRQRGYYFLRAGVPVKFFEKEIK
jgi:hypothetical protein